MDTAEITGQVEVMKLEPGDRLALRVHSADPEIHDLINDAVRHLEEKWGISIMVLGPGVDLTVIREES